DTVTDFQRREQGVTQQGDRDGQVSTGDLVVAGDLEVVSGLVGLEVSLRWDGSETECNIGDQAGDAVTQKIGQVEGGVPGEAILSSRTDAAVVGHRTSGGVRRTAVLSRRPLVHRTQLDDL